MLNHNVAKLLRQQPVAKFATYFQLLVVYDERIGAQSAGIVDIIGDIHVRGELSFVISSKWSNTLSI